MDLPVLILNFKTYPEILGPQGLGLARLCEAVAAETRRSVALVPSLVDLSLTAQEVRIPVLAQHADDLDAGSQTGWIPPSAAKAAGATGTLLNHAEHPIPLSVLKPLIERCHALDLETVVCANDLEAAERVAALGPGYVAVEPPELIGGDVSVTSARPEVVRDAVAAVRKVDAAVQVLCGAGVKSGKDVRKAVELGAQGVLLASGVVKAADPRKALTDLLRGFDT